MHRTWAWLVLLSIPVAAGHACRGDDVEEDADRVARLEVMTRCARDIEFVEHVGQEERAVPLRESPAQRFDDVSRNHRDGTLWLWGGSGRPTATFEIYPQPDKGIVAHAGHSLSTRRVTGKVANGRVLETNGPGVEFADVPRQPAASDDPKRRLLLFRGLSRAFSAHEFWDPDNTRYELRLMPRPVHRYDDPDAGIVDGTVFVFANGTNPEVLLLLELQRDGDEERWRYALARLGHAELHVEFDGREVWTRPLYRQIPPGTPYWMVIRQLKNIVGDDR